MTTAMAEEARIIQRAMRRSQPLHTGSIVVSHPFQPVAEVGGDYLDYFPLTDGSVGLYTTVYCDHARPVVKRALVRPFQLTLLAFSGDN